MKLKEILMAVFFVFLVVTAAIEVTNLYAKDINCSDCYSTCIMGFCDAGEDWECQDCKIFNCNSGQVEVCRPESV